MKLFLAACFSICLVFVVSPIASAEAPDSIRIAEVFTDGAVLQRNTSVRVWGTATPQQKLTVAFADQSINTLTDQEGRWEVSLTPMPANNSGRSLTVQSTDGESTSIKDILVGEVWLAGGQSNMAGTMSNYSETVQPDIDAANDPLLRMITVPRVQYPGHRLTGDFNWRPSNPSNVPQFSATAYYFALNIRKTLNVPVGIISCSYGGTPAEAWMSRATLTAKPDLKRILETYDSYVEREFKDEKQYLARLESYQEDLTRFNQWRKTKDPANRVRKPQRVMGPRSVRRPCGLYETMLTRTIPYSIKGVIWYQGEANANSFCGFHYRSVFSELVAHWRREFKSPNLPFLFVQLASLGRGKEPHWAELRDAQRWVNENVANTGMVVALDAGDRNDIHPHSKDVVGKRLSLLARNIAYGEDALVCEGPRLNFVEPQGKKLALHFERVGTGLVLKEEGENTFEVAGADGRFFPASAVLADGNVILSASEVDTPQHARYGWHAWVVPTLFNQEGLPASGFRSDDYTATSRDNYYLYELSSSPSKKQKKKQGLQSTK